MVLRLLVAEVVAAAHDKIKLGADGLAHQSSSTIISQLSPAECGAVPSRGVGPRFPDGTVFPQG